MAEWNIRKNGKVYGPYSSAQLKELASSGRINEKTEIQQEGSATWHAASKIRNLFDSLTKTPAPAPPVPAAPAAPPTSRQTVSTTVVDVPYRQTIATQVVVNNPSNGLGTAAFVTSVIALLTAGCLSPIALVFSLVALSKPPRGMAIAGTVLSCLGLVPLGFILFSFILVGSAATQVSKVAEQARQNRQIQEEKDAAYLAQVKITNVSHSIETLSYSRQHHIKFTVQNGLDVAIANLHIEFEFKQDGRSVAHAKDGISGDVEGGIEPGETKELDWVPGVGSGDLRTEIPADAIGTGRVISIKDAAGNFVHAK